jgi:hypothetical protein
MSINSSAYLIPLVAAFLLFLFKVYGLENARTRGSFSFVLAGVTVLLLFTYLGMIVLDVMPPYASLAYGVTGVILLGVAVLMIRVF